MHREMNCIKLCVPLCPRWFNYLAFIFENEYIKLNCWEDLVKYDIINSQFQVHLKEDFVCKVIYGVPVRSNYDRPVIPDT